jgi:hypothetical protein
MYGAIGYLIGIFSGSLFVTCIIYALCRWILDKIIPNKKSLAIVSYLFSLLILLTITSFTFGLNYRMLIYAVELLIWLIIDYVQCKNSYKLKEGN